MARRGLLEMREAGAGTMAQDEETSVVWGMPKEAVKLGGVDRILPLDRIAKEVMGWSPIARVPSEVVARKQSAHSPVMVSACRCVSWPCLVATM